MVEEKQRRHGGVATPQQAVSELHSAHNIAAILLMAHNTQHNEITHTWGH